MPSTTGQVLRGRPMRRATMSARAGSPRRAGSVADISTPMNVPCSASTQPHARARQRGAQDRVPRDAAQHHREAHQPERERAPTSGSRRAARRRSGRTPMRCSAKQRERDGEQRGDRRSPRAAASARAPGAARRRRPRQRLERRQARGGHAAAPSAGVQPRRTAAREPRRRGHGDRVLVGAEHLGGDARPGVALRRAARRRRPAHRGAPPGRARGRAAPRPARSASPRGTSTPSTPSRDDVAVAGDVRGDDRRAGRERLGQHHAEALAAQRRRAQHVGALEHAALVRVAALAQRDDAAVVEHQRRDLVAGRRRRRAARRARARAAPRRRAAAPAGPCARRPGR